MEVFSYLAWALIESKVIGCRGEVELDFMGGIWGVGSMENRCIYYVFFFFGGLKDSLERFEVVK